MRSRFQSTRLQLSAQKAPSPPPLKSQTRFSLKFFGCEQTMAGGGRDIGTVSFECLCVFVLCCKKNTN